MRLKSLLSIGAVLIPLALTGCGGGSSSSGGPPSPNGFQALLGATFTNPRCTNCHGFDQGNAEAVQHKDRPRECTRCHTPALTNVPRWRAPIRSFSFSNLSTFEICRGIKNKFGGDIPALRNHFVISPLTAWAVDSGVVPGGRMRPTAPPNSSAALLALVDRWIANGAVCD